METSTIIATSFLITFAQPASIPRAAAKPQASMLASCAPSIKTAANAAALTSSYTITIASIPSAASTIPTPTCATCSSSISPARAAAGAATVTTTRLSTGCPNT